MDVRQCPRVVGPAAALFLLLSPAAALAQSQPQDTPPAAQRSSGPSTRPGVEAFGGAAVSWPEASDSFDASGLGSRTTQVGGGARVTNVWRDLFAEVAVSRWSDTGERVFIDSTGERFPLGIPLSVKATFLDVSAGWKTPVQTGTGRTAVLAYVGAGAGAVMYEESSPFADAGEDLDTQVTSYHAFAGFEFPILRWLAVGVEGRYRHVPDLLGEDGVSGVLGDDSLGGFQMSLALRAGFGGGPRPQPPATAPGPAQEPTRPYVAPPSPRPSGEANLATILSAAPVYLRPDPQRVPLRTLETGTAVRVLEEAGDWLRIEFRDPQFGPRVGYVERKYVRMQD